MTPLSCVMCLFLSSFIVGDGSTQLRDCRGQTVSLMGISGLILHDLNHNTHWQGTKVAWASRCDEPAWADECLQKFRCSSSRRDPIGTLAHSSHIYGGSKKDHFRRIKAEFNHIEFSEMIFFDNEMYNIHNVGPMGVHCVYCPEGMTQATWEEGLKQFSST